MKYDFDEVISRKGTGSVKTDAVKEDGIPMWVADMDFKTAPAIVDAIIKRAQHGIFGYTDPSDEWSNAYINFFHERHGFDFTKDDLYFSIGVIPIISCGIRAFTNPHEGVIILTPVYNHFASCIEHNHRKIVEVPLLLNDGKYSIDFLVLEEAFKKQENKLLIFCNPHNPVGRIWTKEEMRKIGELAKKHNVIVISDEIHGELTKLGHLYIPFASINDINKEISITALSPTKSWNLAGIQTAAYVVFNKKLREQLKEELDLSDNSEGNVFSYIAAIKAYNEGRDFLDELRSYLFENKKVFDTYLKENLPELKTIDEDATYLSWVDISSIGYDSQTFCNLIYENVGLRFNAGVDYGKGGEGFIRVNLATPRKILLEALDRLKQGIKLLKEQSK